MTMAHQRSPASQLLLNNSLSLFKSGKLDKAEEFARKVLAAEPRNADLLQFIAVLCLEQSKLDEAMWQLWREGQALRAIDLAAST
jgi:tetratricopeptide repeat protein